MPLPESLTPIREMCAEFGVTPRTLRFYEAKELIAPVREGQRRRYTRRCRARLTLILQGRRFGFSLEDIRQLLDLYDIGDQQVKQMTRTCELAQERLRAMEVQRDELTRAIVELKERLAEGERMLAERRREGAAATERELT
jgi:DNA-binding transcriptional MerR regulator